MKKSNIIFASAVSVIGFNSCNSEISGNKRTESSGDIERPNLVFYLSDDQNIQDYGCYGNEKVKTPEVDKLASQGMRFTQAFTAQAISAPSRSQLFTGKYPLNNGCFLNHTGVKPEINSITKYLSELGYDVVLAGKSHVKPRSVFNWTAELKVEKDELSTQGVLSIGKIDNYLQNAERPFVMFITSTYPHGPHPEVENVSPDDIKLYPFDKNMDDRYVTSKAAYYKHIENDNTQLEKVLALFQKHEITNTMFIYSADHGHVGKFTVYDAGLNVPFVVSWPGVIEAGVISDKLIHYTDVLPTFIEAAGGKPIDDMDGKSFLSILKGDDKEIHDYVYGVQSNQNVWICRVFPSRMIRSKKFKYIKNFNSIEVVEQNLGPKENVNVFIRKGAEEMKHIPYEELFDIVNDPFELNNLAKDPAYSSIKDELSTKLTEWMTDQGDVLITHGPMPLIKPISHPLDVYSKYNKIPKSLENTLNSEDYVNLHL